MSKTTSMITMPGKDSIDEIIDKETFFIELYKNKVDLKIMESFEEDVEFFQRLNINVQYHRKYDSKNVFYYIEPVHKEYHPIGFLVGGRTR